jgi:hypothetical protein
MNIAHCPVAAGVKVAVYNPLPISANVGVMATTTPLLVIVEVKLVNPVAKPVETNGSLTTWFTMMST